MIIFLKADTTLLGEMGVNKDCKHFTIKLSNKNTINKILHVYYFSVATAFVFYCDAKHLDILQGPSHIDCYLF